MSEWARFGRPDAFEVGLRWVDDPAVPQRRPAGHGWSMGQLELSVAGVSLTASARANQRQAHVGWYLSPVLGWLAEHWGALLHEERFAWDERSALPAAVTCSRILDWVPEDAGGARRYEVAQAWYRRHAIRSAALGGLFPDLYVRRMADDIELSWSGDSPEFAPSGLVFESGAGRARLSVADFARPLWQLLQWAAENPPAAPASFRADIEAFQAKVRSLRTLREPSSTREYVADGMFDLARSAFAEIGRLDLFDHEQSGEVPCIEEFSPAVAMFGGVSPTLVGEDVQRLRDALVEAHGGGDGERLAELVEVRRETPVGVPHQDGERLAAELLEDLGTGGRGDWVDVDAICADLGIAVGTLGLNTDSIRGVAFAGDGFSPSIVVNATHYFNTNDAGRRFTVAHELCHVLFDRTRARRLAHASGAWAAPAIERRANAFAAYLLMPPALVLRGLAGANQIDREQVEVLAGTLQVNRSPLIEHLWNLGQIDEVSRAKLRAGLSLD